MTTTPTIWKARFTPNFQSGTGEQILPQSIGLANGNILTVWEDDTGGSSPGRDIMGQMFAPTGNGIGPAFQVNYAVTSQDEIAPQIAALPDGGYVVAYGSYDSSLGDFIVVQRFDSSGVEVSNGRHFITDNDLTSAAGGLGDWELTVDNNGNYIVTFERAVEYIQHGPFGEDHIFSPDVHAIVYNYVSNNPLPERSVAQNTSDTDYLGKIATFNDGNVITVTNEYDNDLPGVEYMIWQSSTGSVVVPPVAVAGGDAEGISVAVLTGGQFVITYYRFDPSLATVMRIGASDAPGAALSPESIIVGAVVSSKVVALNDGGFMVAWADYDGVVHGTRYTVDGTVVGTAGFEIATGAVSPHRLGDLSLTSDGRVLVTWLGSDLEIAEAIVDPREPVINGTDNSEGLTTQTGDSTVLAHGGDDTVYGLGGDDWIDGGAGADTLRGGGGNDVYFLSDVHQIDPLLNLYAYDSVVELADQGIDKIHVAYAPNAKTTYVLPANIEYGVIDGNDVFNLTGNGLDNELTGNTAANILTGGAGADTLNGDAGADTMIGGIGNDTYVVDNAGDNISENANEGIDTVYTTAHLRLTANLENLVLQGSANLQGFGNVLSNSIYGNSGNNLLDGDVGADSMFGGGGNDTYFVDNAGDGVVENTGEGTDAVFSSVHFTLSSSLENLILQGSADLQGYGNSLTNTIYGNTGNNLLDGRAGADLMLGGAGNDTYFVDDISDSAFESAGEGSDAVFATVNYGLAAGVETLVLQGNADLQGYGNNQMNTLYGNTGNNLLNAAGGADLMVGGVGNDTYFVDDISDSAFESAGEGSDAVFSTVNYRLAADVETLVLQGSADLQGYGSNQANTLYGNTGNNLLDGAGGADIMFGGIGNDTYFVDAAGDVVFENSGEGTDAVLSTVNYGLSANVETLVLQGASNLSGTGNALANGIFGNTGDNIIDGGAGADQLTGGDGNDTFVFRMGQGGGDTVVDFAGNGGAAGDSLLFVGYGAGATFTNIDATHWQANFNGGTSHEIIAFSNAASIHASDFLFS